MRRLTPPPQYPIARVLEHVFGAADVPRVRGAGHRQMLCPFHMESNPSASVSEFGFMCFGCGVSGDAIKLLREQEGLSFADAVARCEECVGGQSRDVPPAGSWGGDLLG